MFRWIVHIVLFGFGEFLAFILFSFIFPGFIVIPKKYQKQNYTFSLHLVWNSLKKSIIFVFSNSQHQHNDKIPLKNIPSFIFSFFGFSWKKNSSTKHHHRHHTRICFILLHLWSNSFFISSSWNFLMFSPFLIFEHIIQQTTKF